MKTLAPTRDPGPVLARSGGGSVADSFGLLDLGTDGFDLLIEASWLHHPGLPGGPVPDGWVEVRDDAAMATWSRRHDYVGVLPDDVWTRPGFGVWARGEDGGAVLHDAAPCVVGLSNAWGVEDAGELLRLAAAAHPGRAVVDYAWGDDLAAMVAAGFAEVGPQLVWVPAQA